MAYERNPNDPHSSPDDAYRSNVTDHDIRDPELAEGRSSGGKVAMFAVAIAVVLGALFYGLNNTAVNQAGTSSTAQNTQQGSPPAAPPGMRDVTPRTNIQPGTTTGAAPTRPQTPPSSAPAGPDMNRTGTPPTGNTQPGK